MAVPVARWLGERIELVEKWRREKAVRPREGLSNRSFEVVHDLAGPLVEEAKRFGTNIIFVAPHAMEASGENAIPETLAAYLAHKLGTRDDVTIVQRNKVYHTGADAMERIIAPSEFAGAVEAGAQYVLVDDVSTMGGTLADLSSYIQTNGGQVVGSVLLVNAARSGKILPSIKTLRLLERRFGDEIRTTFGIEPAALTREEAEYLIGFRSVDELRNRAAAAKQARIERLRSKGIYVEEMNDSQGSL
jgi:orotate phosphoribosyltransferase